MTDTLELAVRKLAYLDWIPGVHKTEEEHFEANKEEYMQNVRTVLSSIRVPGESVLDAGERSLWDRVIPQYEREAAEQTWRAMIDAILREGE